MSLPIPEVPLHDACSIIFNNTLYSYSNDAFQSLPMEEGGVWSKLPMGESVKGGVCVKSTPKDEKAAALYIVGGTSTKSDYQGLQRYTFANASWETITPSVPVTQNRLYHNAVYLNSSDAILMYAGRQDGSEGPSSQTFTIQATQPYAVSAYSSIARPAVHPLLMPWTNGSAVYIGGSNDNTQVMIFDPASSWTDSYITLAEPIYNTTAVKAIVLTADDGSKSLYTFDMSVAPNAVNRTVLIDGDGKPLQNSAALVSTNSAELETTSGKLVVRDGLTLAQWPTYNNTLAPKSTRTSYSIAENTNGEVVISGGNEEDVLCIFQARSNSWANASAVLNQEGSQTLVTSGSSGSSSASNSATSSAAPAPVTSAPSPSAATTSNHPSPGKILGAVLGSLVGAALLLTAALIFFRWRRRRRDHAEAGHQRRASGFPEEKDPQDFMETHSPNTTSARQVFKGHGTQESQSSFSSMAILMGRMGHRRGSKVDDNFGSDASRNFNKFAISNPIPHEPPAYTSPEPSKDLKEVSFGEGVAVPRPRTSKTGRRGSMRRSSGWNRYWSGGSVLNNLGIGSRRTTLNDDGSSMYSDQRPPTMLSPLRIGGQPELNRVASGSPTVASHSSEFPIQGAMSGHLERPASVSSQSTYNTRHDAYSSGIPESVRDYDEWPISRPSNAYTESVYTTSGQARGTTGYPLTFPAPPNPQRPSQPAVSSDMSWLNLGTHDTKF